MSTPPPKPAELRLLDALNYCSSMLEYGVDPVELVEKASRHGHVDKHELAVLWPAGRRRVARTASDEGER
jgi:hypothetical protein